MYPCEESVAIQAPGGPPPRESETAGAVLGEAILKKRLDVTTERQGKGTRNKGKITFHSIYMRFATRDSFTSLRRAADFGVGARRKNAQGRPRGPRGVCWWGGGSADGGGAPGGEERFRSQGGVLTVPHRFLRF